MGYSYPVLINCTFSGNVALTGGGMYTEYPFVLINTPTVTNCIFWGNTPEQIIGSTTVTYSDIQGGWPGTGNIDSDPCFVDIDNPAGPDANFGTWDDGLRLTRDSNCIDAADGNAAPATDILGHGRIEVYNVDNNGIGEPNYADIGAYEFRDGGIVVMVWIDESTGINGKYHVDGGDVTFDGDMVNYRALLNSGDVSIVQSGCLVPLPAGEGGFTTIEGVLPENYFEPDPVPEYVSPDDPPEGISIYKFPRTDPNLNDFISHFDRIRNGVVPDYLILIVDNSGSMTTATINPSPDYPYTTQFITWLDDTYSISVNNGNLIRRDGAAEFTNERWVDEMRIQIQSVIDGL